MRSLRSQLLLAGLLFQCLLLTGYFLLTSSMLREGMRDNLQVAARQLRRSLIYRSPPMPATAASMSCKTFSAS